MGQCMARDVCPEDFILSLTVRIHSYICHHFEYKLPYMKWQMYSVNSLKAASGFLSSYNLAFADVDFGLYQSKSKKY